MIGSFSASPSPANPGDAVTLSWSVSGATSLSIDQGVGPVTGTSTVVHPTLTTTYTLTADPGGVTAQATAVVNVVVTVAPDTVSLLAEQTQQFTATVAGTTNTAVTWDVQEGSAGGSVDATGLYTAPMASGTFHVRATSLADGTAQGVATVTVTRPPPGTLDVTFGDGGIVVLAQPDGGPAYATAVAIAQDGAIFVGGGTAVSGSPTIYPVPGASSRFILYKLTTSGSVAPLQQVISSSSGGVTEIRQLTSGTVLLAGPSDLGNGWFAAQLERRMPNGALDPTFGILGKYLTSRIIPPYTVGVFLYPNENIGIVGRSSANDGGTSGIDEWDPDFLNLVQTTPNPIVDGPAFSQALPRSLSDGGYLIETWGVSVAATLTQVLFDQSDLSTIGVIDGGTQTASVLDIATSSTPVHSTYVAHAGNTSSLARYLINPRVFDTQFQSNALNAMHSSSVGMPSALGINAQSDGNIIVTGTSTVTFQLTVCRLSADGSLDTSFGTNGGIHVAMGNFASGNRVAIQPDGKIIVVGVGGSPSRMIVVRLWP